MTWELAYVPTPKSRSPISCGKAFGQLFHAKILAHESGAVKNQMTSCGPPTCSDTCEMGLPGQGSPVFPSLESLGHAHHPTIPARS